jgi:phosphoglycolate phosphatase-like HAD superfamily hydrolase
VPAQHPRAEQPPVAFVDLDGVLADVRHRLHHVTRRPKDWDAFFAAAARDGLHPEGKAVVERLRQDHQVVYLTGRPERCRADTEAWLARHGLDGHELVMRSSRDRRPAATVKVEVIARRFGDREVAIVVDDDDRVVAAMRAAGHPVLHADWEQRLAAEAAALDAAQEVDGRT